MHLVFRPALPALLSLFALAARAADTIPSRPDPRETPVPKIKVAARDLPGPDALPERKAMPDPMVLNDGTRVATPEQWQKRRTEIREVLEYYHVGRLPPAPGNVKGSEVSSQLLLGGKEIGRAHV